MACNDWFSIAGKAAGNDWFSIAGKAAVNEWFSIAGKAAGNDWFSIAGKAAGNDWFNIAGKAAVNEWFSIAGKAAGNEWFSTAGKAAVNEWFSIAGKAAVPQTLVFLLSCRVTISLERQQHGGLVKELCPSRPSFLPQETEVTILNRHSGGTVSVGTWCQFIVIGYFRRDNVSTWCQFIFRSDAGLYSMTLMDGSYSWGDKPNEQVLQRQVGLKKA